MVTALLLKAARGSALSPVRQLPFSRAGITGGVACSPLRQVLLLPTSTLRAFKLRPGDLRENVVVEFDSLHDLPSGTTLAVGEARIRLTVHCEPCGRVADKVRPAAVLHQRGYLGAFLNEGILRLGDPVVVGKREHDAIPYPIAERLEWFLRKRREPISATAFLLEVGLSNSYARALPALLRKIPPQLRELVVFGSSPRRDDSGRMLV